MYRELAEEIGLGPQDVRIVGVTRRWLRYRLPPRFQRRDQLPLCIGQKQRWYLLESHSAEPPVRFDTTGTPEFCEWRWSDWWDPVREVIHFKRPVYRRALHELGRFAFPGGLPPYPGWWGGG
jgi:putative (di)nucleoside polyphosphate hydrolase